MVLGRSLAGSLFVDGALSVGLVLPVRSQEDRVDFQRQIALARRAESVGIDAIWVRDVPLNGPWYPEHFGHSDPFVMLGALAAATDRIALGTAAVVLPLRHPIHVAKAALSIQELSGGRLVLGLGSGDREPEYAAFGAEYTERRALFRSQWLRLREALEHPLVISPDVQTDPPTTFELRPQPQIPIPMIAVGSGGQTLGWIARNAAGWATYHREPAKQRGRYGLWKQALESTAPGLFRSFSQALRIDLEADQGGMVEPVELGYRVDAKGLFTVLDDLRQAGAHHAMLNLVANGRNPEIAIDEIGEQVISHLARTEATTSSAAADTFG